MLVLPVTVLDPMTPSDARAMAVGNRNPHVRVSLIDLTPDGYVGLMKANVKVTVAINRIFGYCPCHYNSIGPEVLFCLSNLILQV